MAESKSPPLSKLNRPNKSVEDKKKKVSTTKTMSDRAKETINRMLKSTQKPLINPS